MRWGSSVFLALASLVVGAKGFWILLKYKRYFAILGHLSFLIGFPFLFFGLLNYIHALDVSTNTRVIIVIPLICMAPVWFVWGFFVNSSAEKVEEQKQL